MKKTTNFFILIFMAAFSKPSLASDVQTKLQLFKRLNGAGIDQVVEIPYNTSLVAQLGRQAKVYNVDELQEHSNYLPEPESLLDVFNDSFEYHNQRPLLPSLFYKVSDQPCGYVEAVKVSNTLVCYRRAHENFSALAPVRNYGPRCTTVRSQLSHCYIFAYRVDEVIRAIAASEE